MHPFPPNQPGASDALEGLQTALRELHGASVQGFALLLTLGDQRRATALTAEAFLAADAHITTLRHPERAAAWLRSRVMTRAGRRDSRLDAATRLEALGDLGVTGAVLAGLAALTIPERAALIASRIEHLDERDVATIVDRSGNRLAALLRRSLTRFLGGYAATADGPVSPAGPLHDRVRAAAARAMA